MAPSGWTEDVVGALIARQREALETLGQTAVPIDGTWESRIDALEAEIDEKPEVRIALLGGTGAGKSTLVNALAGERILPVNNMKACTAAISELTYRERGYGAVVEFIDRDAWLEELHAIEGDARDHISTVGEGPGADNISISQANADKLKALYGADAAEQFGRDADVSKLVETDEVRRAFEDRTRGFEFTEAKDFRKELKRYLSSDDEFWPIVKNVRVEGPFAPLANGVTLVDLPGLNDPNVAREETTKRHLKEAQFVWVVFNMKRAVTREIFEFLQADDLLRRLFMDGRTGTLSFVGTASDLIDPDTDIDELDLDDECSEMEIVIARNERVREYVSGQLDELVRNIGSAAGASSEEVVAFQRSMTSSPIFCVSARDHMQLNGLSRNKTSTITDPEVTEIPALLRHITDLAEANGREAQLRGIGSRVSFLGEEMFLAVTSRQAQIRLQVESSDRELKEVQEAASEAERFLSDRLIQVHEKLGFQLSSASELLEERLRTATSNAKGALNRLSMQWRGMHWATLRATVRRDGRWVSSTGMQIDIADDIAKPILDGVAFAWVDFFENKATAIVETAADASANAAESYIERFGSACRGNPVARELFEQFGDQMTESTRTIVRDSVKQAKKEIQLRLRDDRRELNEWITRRVAKELEPAFRKAAQEEGKGMRDRMVEIVHRHATASAGSMFDDVEAHVEELLESLSAYIVARSKELDNKLKGEGKKLAQLVQSQTAEASDAESLKMEQDALITLTTNIVRPAQAA